MIEYATGNLLNANVEALVNTVNCVGIMGKGIALQFKQAYPANFVEYQKACKENRVQLGQMFITQQSDVFKKQYIINFPTKQHWRDKSEIEDIKAGLSALVADVKELDIKSLAIPPLGCGNGGLNWEDVRPLIVSAFAPLTNLCVLIYEPKGAPLSNQMPIAPKKIKMTRARVLLIKLIEQYQTLDYRLGRLEIQKLAYFLQEAGEPLQLNYVKHQYGPYADNLRHVLLRMEGKYTRGYGDGSSPSEIYILPEAIESADEFLVQSPQTVQYLERVQTLIAGYETPYGMELLATTHWLAKETPSLEQVIKGFELWDERKRDKFRINHIKSAYTRLADQGWVTHE